MAKFALRGVNFSCSLIVLSMMSTTFAIFNATKSLPAENNLPAWANNTNAWPQKLVLAAACVSLVVTVVVLSAYCRGGHRRAEKVSVYYTIFAVVWFIISMIMWAFAAGILQYTRNNSSNQDIWGWSCVQNKRAEQFGQKVDYALVCRLQVSNAIECTPNLKEK
jgi:amino acid transporter